MYSTYRYGCRNLICDRMDSFEMKLTASYVKVIRGCELKTPSSFQCILCLNVVKYRVRMYKVAVYFES